MYISRIAVEGMGGLAPLEAAGLGRSVSVRGPARARSALADALTLALATFGERDARIVAERLGWGEVEVTGDPLPEQIQIPRQAAARHLAAPSRAGDPLSIRIELDLALDPPQFDQLRAAARRNPALGPALLGMRELRLAVGWLFTRDFSVASPSVLSVALGDLSLDPSDRPPWLVKLLRGLAGRLHRRRPGDLAPALFVRADRSTEPEDRSNMARLQADLAAAPFRLGRLYLVDAGPDELRLTLGPDLVPASAVGPTALDALGLLADVHLHPAEILLVEQPAALFERRRGAMSWLRRQAEADGSPLEQIWLFGAPGRADIEAASP